jgi:hypothetical protein
MDTGLIRSIPVAAMATPIGTHASTCNNSCLSDRLLLVARYWAMLNASGGEKLMMGNPPPPTPSMLPLRVRFENRERDSAGGSVAIQALDVDRAKPWPDGQDRQEDQALPV